MNEIILNVHYLIDDILTVIPTKMYYEESKIFYKRHNKKEMCDEDSEEFFIEKINIHFEFNIDGNDIISIAKNDMEYAIKYLQKSLPSNISLACCQSCKHGNFNPYGDNENEIFCLKGIVNKHENDVIEYFRANGNLVIKKLLNYCNEYEPIDQNNYYTYNDWGINFEIPTIYIEQVKEALNKIYPDIYDHIDKVPQLPNDIGEKILSLLLQYVCSESIIYLYTLAREKFTEISLDWLLKHITNTANVALCFDDLWQYRSFLGFTAVLSPILLSWAIEQGIDSEDEKIKEAAEFFKQNESLFIEYFEKKN